MPEWYPALLSSVSGHVAAGRRRSLAAVNQQPIQTYWAIGRDILDRQESEGWGSKVIDRLSADLRQQFPEAKGFSPRSLKYMRAFAAAWSKDEIVQQPAALLPWGHQMVLLDKGSDTEARLWYAAAAVEHGWSRNVLVHHIESKRMERTGKAVTNFTAILPPEDSDLAQQSFKDPYVFDFVAMTDRRNERELENQLVDHIQKFLLELGQGFAFVGRQVKLQINAQEFFADLLFYNFKLRCFVVIELKATEFKPGTLASLACTWRQWMTYWPTPMTNPLLVSCCASPRTISWPSTLSARRKCPLVSPSGKPRSWSRSQRNSHPLCPASATSKPSFRKIFRGEIY